MSSLLFIGECMLEIREHDEAFLKQGFAGDMYNAAVYAKLVIPSADVSFLTAAGNDPLSAQMLARFEKQGVNSQYVLRSDDRQLGIYAVTNDAAGERYFSYWRKDSAATQMMHLLDSAMRANLKADLVFFSGISLGILSEQDRQLLLDLVVELQSRGAKVAFDPNYRANQWQDVQSARAWFEKAYHICDIALPGLEDHEALFAHSSREQVCDYLATIGVQEVVVKCGKAGVYVYENGQQSCHLPFTPAPVQRDATAAGDSFAGSYLAARMAGKNTLASVTKAAEVAAEVVQVIGAFTPPSSISALTD